MRISDWSSDVCSSDLISHVPPAEPKCGAMLPPARFATCRCQFLVQIVDIRRGSSPMTGPLHYSKTKARGHSTRDLVSSRSEEHTSELQSLMRISYAVFCLKKKKTNNTQTNKAINYK